MKTKVPYLYRDSEILSAVMALLGAFLLTNAPSASACGDYKSLHLFQLAQQAVLPDQKLADEAIAELRQEGRKGLDALFTIHNTAIYEHLTNGVNPNWPRIRLALERVSGQRDCAESRLFWHTDLDLAREEAAKSGKPILSLRLLGRLDEELSCANSRFFRTALYANAEVSQLLRDQFVLHWESVRPAPRVTIDFGDGRKLERTITGNSIHYVLDAEGRPLDALPGLEGPKACMAWLNRVHQLHHDLAAAEAEKRDGLLSAYHAERKSALDQQWEQDIETAGLDASAKSNPTETLWTKLAALHQDEARLDVSSRGLMARKYPDAYTAARVAFSKMVVESPLIKAMRQFERSIAEDTVRNEYQLHRTIHGWFAEAQASTGDLNHLNDRIYTELFLTPRSDPWLGFKPDGIYSALDGDGVVIANRK